SVTFLLTLVGWIIFRAESIGQAVGYLQGICSRSLFSIPEMPGIGITRPLAASTLCFIFILFATEWWHREREHGLSLHVKNQAMRYIIYIVLLWALLFFPATEPATFVYFQF
ncbi:MAG: MBOAT family protein, partial [Tannerella sp.]|nr:MBOAT family protein [Tannerella sp.]